MNNYVLYCIYQKKHRHTHTSLPPSLSHPPPSPPPPTKHSFGRLRPLARPTSPSLGAMVRGGYASVNQSPYAPHLYVSTLPFLIQHKKCPSLFMAVATPSPTPPPKKKSNPQSHQTSSSSPGPGGHLLRIQSPTHSPPQTRTPFLPPHHS